MSELVEHLKAEIAAQGTIDLAYFMGCALGHPRHGYYMKRDPLGAGGDFTTAPEISQMFGEVLGAWAADVWLQMGKPSAFIFLECGPGRGTLMADIMRATKNVPGFHAAARIHLLETSPVLRMKQKQSLDGYRIIWHEQLSSLTDRKPMIVIANEFLDALPIWQVQKTGGAWRERRVGWTTEDGFHFVPGPILEGDFPDGPEGSVFEFSPARDFFVQDLCALLRTNGGAALLIDYGHEKTALGDTLQAVQGHAYVKLFEHVGDADITSHVDFEAVARAAQGLRILGPVTQGAFLEAVGIGKRAAYLFKQADEAQKADIEKALRRLTDSSEMGTLFKVMGLCDGDIIQPGGF